jgi:uncharacterized protein RhaS with RHS repeats
LSSFSRASLYDSVYTYDKNGNLIRRSGPEGVRSYAYDEEGRLIEGTNEVGEISRYRYDA